MFTDHLGLYFKEKKKVLKRRCIARTSKGELVPGLRRCEEKLFQRKDQAKEDVFYLKNEGSCIIIVLLLFVCFDFFSKLLTFHFKVLGFVCLFVFSWLQLLLHCKRQNCRFWLYLGKRIMVIYCQGWKTCSFLFSALLEIRANMCVYQSLRFIWR